MGESVGKISLELEIASDLQKELSTATKRLGNNVGSSLKTLLSKDFSGIDKAFGKTVDSI